MKRTLLALSTLAITSFVIGCSGGGGGGGKPDDKNNKGTQPTAMTANAWCANGNDQQSGKDYQTKITLKTTGRFQLEQFWLEAGARGEKVTDISGTWSVKNNNTLVYTPEGGQTQEAPLRVDPNSPTGAPQLNIGGIAYDPCA